MIFKRLKIVEQIIIISLIGVLVPSVISGFIVNNVNQHSIRKELGYSAQMLANTIENNIVILLGSEQRRLEEIIIALKHIPNQADEDTFLKDLAINSDVFQNFEIIHPSEIPDFDATKRIVYNQQEQKVWLVEKINDDKYIRAEITTDVIKKNIFNNIENEKDRRFYVVDKTGKLLFTQNYDEEDFNKSVKQLPINLVNNIATRFDEIKNQPRVYLKRQQHGCSSDTRSGIYHSPIHSRFLL